jgi:hypothetical protein
MKPPASAGSDIVPRVPRCRPRSAPHTRPDGTDLLRQAPNHPSGSADLLRQAPRDPNPPATERFGVRRRLLRQPTGWPVTPPPGTGFGRCRTKVGGHEAPAAPTPDSPTSVEDAKEEGNAPSRASAEGGPAPASVDAAGTLEDSDGFGRRPEWLRPHCDLGEGGRTENGKEATTAAMRHGC